VVTRSLRPLGPLEDVAARLQREADRRPGRNPRDVAEAPEGVDPRDEAENA